MKLQLENLRKLRTAIINRPMRLQLIICHKKELLPSLSSIKLVLIRNIQDKNKFKCTNEAVIGKSSEIADSNN